MRLLRAATPLLCMAGGILVMLLLLSPWFFGIHKFAVGDCVSLQDAKLYDYERWEKRAKTESSMIDEIGRKHYRAHLLGREYEYSIGFYSERYYETVPCQK